MNKKLSLASGRRFPAAAAACAALFLLCGFTPSENDMKDLSAEQKAFVSASDWSGIADDVIATKKSTDIQDVASRAIVIYGCMYQQMPEPKWLPSTSSREYRMRRMLADVLLAKAMDEQMKAAKGGQSVLGNDFSNLMDRIFGKVMEELHAGEAQTPVIVDIVSRHLLDAMKSPAK